MIKLNNKTRILVFGTFDVLHKGHIKFFQQARRLSAKPFLIVSVARDINVKLIKGRFPEKREKQRLKEIKKIKIVNQAVLGANKNYLSHIIKTKPQIIALGYDQKSYTKNLKSQLNKLGLSVKIFRLRPYRPNIYKSSIIKKYGNRHRSGAGK
jgi:FAD synthetase